MKVTTHLPTETSAPTYMKRAMANNKNDGLRNRLPASFIDTDSECIGLGNLEAVTSNNKIAPATAKDPKIMPSPPRCCRHCTTNGRDASPRPKQMSSEFNAEVRHVSATSATSA